MYLEFLLIIYYIYLLSIHIPIIYTYTMLCPPAVLYLIYGLIHVIIDAYKNLYNLCVVEAVITIVFTLLLQLLCSLGLGIISWIFIAIPFIAMGLITSVVIGMFTSTPNRPLIRTLKKPDYNIPPFYGSLGLSTRPQPTSHASPPVYHNQAIEPHINSTKYDPARDGMYVENGIPVCDVFHR